MDVGGNPFSEIIFKVTKTYVPREGLEPSRWQAPSVFETDLYTNSSIAAIKNYKKITFNYIIFY